MMAFGRWWPSTFCLAPFGPIPGGGNGSICGGGFEQNTQAGEKGALAASNYLDFGPASVLHGIDPPPAGYSGVERRVDLVDRVLPALAVTFAGYKERKHEYCLQVLHVVDPHSVALKAL